MNACAATAASRVKRPVFSLERLQPILAGYPRSSRLWIAFSGGCDSHVLLYACAQLRARLGLDLAAIHVDHGLSSQSTAWEHHCRLVCAGLGVAYHTERIVIERRSGESLEALARAARRGVLERYLADGELVATGHHLDDQAETLLLALLRGSGVHGLAGMAPIAPFGAGWLVRPLLDFSRADLRAYARQQRLAWLDDPSNHDTDFDRNRVRHQVLPLLRERWPSAATTIARSARHCAEAAALVDAIADEQLANFRGSKPGSLSVARLSALETERARVLLRRWLAQQGVRPPSSARLQAIFTGFLSARADARPLVAWGGCELRRYRDDLFALAPLPPRPEVELCWDGQQPLQLPAGLGWINLETDGAEPIAPHPALPMTLCFGVSGLRCCRPDQPSRSLKKLFQQAGVPSWLRPYVPLLLDAQGDLVAVAGVSACGGRTFQAGGRLRWEGHPWARFGWFTE